MLRRKLYRDLWHYKGTILYNFSDGAYWNVGI